MSNESRTFERCGRFGAGRKVLQNKTVHVLSQAQRISIPSACQGRVWAGPRRDFSRVGHCGIALDIKAANIHTQSTCQIKARTGAKIRKLSGSSLLQQNQSKHIEAFNVYLGHLMGKFRVRRCAQVQGTLVFTHPKGSLEDRERSSGSF